MTAIRSLAILSALLEVLTARAETAEDLATTEARVFYEEGVKYMQAGDHERAIELFDRVIIRCSGTKYAEVATQKKQEIEALLRHRERTRANELSPLSPGVAALLGAIPWPMGAGHAYAGRWWPRGAAFVAAGILVVAATAIAAHYEEDCPSNVTCDGLTPALFVGLSAYFGVKTFEAIDAYTTCKAANRELNAKLLSSTKSSSRVTWVPLVTSDLAGMYFGISY